MGKGKFTDVGLQISVHSLSVRLLNKIGSFEGLRRAKWAVHSVNFSIMEELIIKTDMKFRIIPSLSRVYFCACDHYAHLPPHSQV